MNRKHNPPAFPRPQSKDFDREKTYSISEQDGMTLRDYFAGQALAGMLTTAADQCLNGLDGHEPHTATAAYQLADAMLEAR